MNEIILKKNSPTTPSSPPDGFVKLYADEDGLKTLEAGGVETPVGSGGNASVNTRTAVDYHPVLSDAGKAIYGTNESGLNVIIPSNATVPFPIGTRFEVAASLSAPNFTASIGVGFVIPDGKQELGTAPGSTIYARKVETNSWVISGDLAAA